jgi:4-hydroxybenzoate polyprenyltransferase
MKWWIYQRERFPVLLHGLVIAAFSSCAVAYTVLVDGGQWSWRAFGVALIVSFLFFLQLRIADEFKDKEEDAHWRPYRPVPRGLVRLSELRMIFVFAAVVQAFCSWWLSPQLLWVLVVGWSYLALMSVEFFCRDALKARPVIYLITHMGIMPLVDFYATACEWMPRSAAVPVSLGWFLTASFCNGMVIEIGRKLRQPNDEEEGVETYSALWGTRVASCAWCGVLTLTMCCAAMAARIIDFFWPVVALMLPLCAASWWLRVLYLRGTLGGSGLEKFAAAWTLALYFLLGWIPLMMR